MAFPFTLKEVLKRGALVAAANWPVAIVQATADSLFKLLIAAPLIGGVFLVALVVGAEPIELMSLEWRQLAATIASTLLVRPAVLAAWLAAGDSTIEPANNAARSRRIVVSLLASCAPT